MLNSDCFQSGAPGDRLSSSPRRHWKESVLVSAEDPSASQTTKISLSHQRNGQEDRKGSTSNTEETRGSTRQTHQDHLNQGPASCAVSDGRHTISGTNIEFIKRKEQASRTNSKEQALFHNRSGSGTQQEHFLGRTRHQESPSRSKSSLNKNSELDQAVKQSRRKVDPNLDRTTLGNASGQNRERQCGSPLPGPHLMGSRSSGTSPAFNNPHQASSLTRSEQNGDISPFFNDGRCSPLLSRSSRSQKIHKVHQQSHADPRHGASPPGQDSHSVLSRAERMAALERRMMANGLSAPGRSRAGHKRLGQAGVTHVGAVQMSEDCTTSGSESSESEVENRGNCSSPVTGSPVEATSSIPRNKFSFGSLQLDEDAEVDECHVFSDEDGGHIFSC